MKCAEGGSFGIELALDESVRPADKGLLNPSRRRSHLFTGRFALWQRVEEPPLSVSSESESRMAGRRCFPAPGRTRWTRPAGDDVVEYVQFVMLRGQLDFQVLLDAQTQRHDRAA